jgi:hypothetical protein
MEEDIVADEDGQGEAVWERVGVSDSVREEVVVADEDGQCETDWDRH